MRINNISPGSAFGRVIKVNSISNPGRLNVPVDESTYDVARVLNGERVQNYSEKEAKRIRGFFKDILGDYNGKDGIVMRKIGKDVFLLSGEDAAKHKEYMKEQAIKAEQYDYKNRKKFLINVRKVADNRILNKAENGENSRRNSDIEFAVNGFHPNDRTIEELVGLEPIDVKFDKIIYNTIKTRPGVPVRMKARHLELEI